MRLGLLICYVPIINVLCDLSVAFLPSGLFFYIVITRVAFFMLILLQLYEKYKVVKTRTSDSIIIFLGYLFALCFFSSNYNLTFYFFLRVFIVYSMFSAGVYLAQRLDYFFLFLKVNFFVMFLLVINYLLSQIFKIGISAYQLDSDFYLGGGGIHLITLLAFLFVVVPLMAPLFYKKWMKIWFYCVLILSVLFIVLAVKRIAVAAMVVEVAVLLLYRKNTVRNIILLSVLVIVAAICVNCIPYLKENVENRKVRMEETDLAEDKQAVDFHLWYNDFKDQPYRFVFGRELFNSKNVVGGIEKRNIHVDYFVLLHGAGIVGLLLYLNIYFQCYKECTGYLRRSRSQVAKMVIKPSLVALIVGVLTVSLSSGMTGITNRTFVMMTLGCFVGMAKRFNKSDKYLQDFIRWNSNKDGSRSGRLL